MVQRMALRNSQTALVTYIATEVTAIAGSMSLIEYVFAWGGVGQYGLNAIIASDFAVVQAYVLLLAVFSVLVFLAVDVAVLAFDPPHPAARMSVTIQPVRSGLGRRVHMLLGAAKMSPTLTVGVVIIAGFIILGLLRPWIATVFANAGHAG